MFLQTRGSGSIRLRSLSISSERVAPSPTEVQWAHNWSSSLSNVPSHSIIAERENANTGPSIRQEHARSTLASPILAMQAPARAPVERERRRLRLRWLGHKGCLVRLTGTASQQGSQCSQVSLRTTGMNRLRSRGRLSMHPSNQPAFLSSEYRTASTLVRDSVYHSL